MIEMQPKNNKLVDLYNPERYHQLKVVDDISNNESYIQGAEIITVDLSNIEQAISLYKSGIER